MEVYNSSCNSYSSCIPKQKFRLKVYTKFLELFLKNEDLYNSVKINGDLSNLAIGQCDLNLDKLSLSSSLNSSFNLFAKKTAINLERGIYNNTIKTLKLQDSVINQLFRDIYIGHAVYLYRNLNPDFNSYLLGNLFQKTFTITELVEFNTIEKINPDAYEKQCIECDIKPNVTYQETIPEDYIGMHKCPRCRSQRTIYSLFQNRSGDESSQVRCICFCGYKWNYNP
jgi:DNA-directed RNA polymerase subunit M/transcription elongation factor TFIIS